jgi:hypothetical protein
VAPARSSATIEQPEHVGRAAGLFALGEGAPDPLAEPAHLGRAAEAREHGQLLEVELGRERAGIVPARFLQRGERARGVVAAAQEPSPVEEAARAARLAQQPLRHVELAAREVQAGARLARELLRFLAAPQLGMRRQRGAQEVVGHRRVEERAVREHPAIGRHQQEAGAEGRLGEAVARLRHERRLRALRQAQRHAARVHELDDVRVHREHRARAIGDVEARIEPGHGQHRLVLRAGTRRGLVPVLCPAQLLAAALRQPRPERVLVALALLGPRRQSREQQHQRGGGAHRPRIAPVRLLRGSCSPP